MTDLVAVVYIGQKAVKQDNVLNTRRLWRGRGAKVECPRADAEVYFSYPDIWAPADVANKLIADRPIEPVQKPEEQPVHAAVRVDTSERAALIQGAILQLDPKNEDHFTQLGRPRVKAVIDTIGFSVEAAEIDAALRDLRALGKISG